MSTDRIEGVVLVMLLVACLLWWLVRGLGRVRPEFRIGAALAVAFGVRLAAIAGIGLTGLQSTLRGGDETTFLAYARILARQPLSTAYVPHGQFQLQTVLFALEDKLGFLTVGAMRIVQVGIALTGVILIAVAVHDLAGPRAAKLAAWLLALEPASIFFNSALHKEPNMELATGLVVFGGTIIWKCLDVRGMLLCALGGLIAVETRSYVGWFLVSAAVLVLLQASLRRLDRPLKALPVLYAVVTVAFLATPTLLAASSKKNLEALQQSQNANANGLGEGSSGANSDNLKLERVDFSSRSKILLNLPQRIRDLVLKPYPWQLGDTSQRFGAVGTLVAYCLLALLLLYGWRSRGQILSRAGPVLWPLLFMLVAYALAVGNAGTGFRYRTHLVTLAIAAVTILREQAHRAPAGEAESARPRTAAQQALGRPFALPARSMTARHKGGDA